MPTITRLFRSPFSLPNGIQATADGLWVADQITDRVAFIGWGPPNEYGVTQYQREISTESSNTSGLTWGDGSLWLAANGPGTLWRPARPTDAAKGHGDILRVDPVTGATLGRWPVPDGGGVHGIEYDPLEPGYLWVTTLHSQTLSKVWTADWRVDHVLPLPLPRAHGVVRVPDGIWVVHTSHRVIVKHKGAAFSETKTPRPVADPAKLAVLTTASAIADEWVTPMRLEHVLQRVPADDMSAAPKVIAAMVEDVYREGKGEVVESREATTAIGRKTAELLKKYLMNRVANV